MTKVTVRHIHESSPYQVEVDQILMWANDLRATLVMKEMRKEGFEVPEDFELAPEDLFTIDDYLDAKEFLNDEGDVEVYDDWEFGEFLNSQYDSNLDWEMNDVYEYDRDSGFE